MGSSGALAAWEVETDLRRDPELLVSGTTFLERHLLKSLVFVGDFRVSNWNHHVSFFSPPVR